MEERELKAGEVDVRADMKRLLGNFSRLGARSGRIGQSHYPEELVAINAHEEAMVQASSDDLEEAVAKIKHKVKTDQLSKIEIIEHFAIVREVARRELGLIPYNVQLIGGLGLYEGKIIQMNTGEGKTLAAVIPAALRAYSGLGVHVLTFNDYLAQRDAAWMGPIYNFLGLSVGCIQEGMGRRERKRAYQADVTYLTAKEAGFDFLRDGLAYEIHDVVQRPYQTAIVDEADSILIDEARVPLVIAGSSERICGQQELVRSAVSRLEAGIDYSVDEFGRNVYLTEEGSTRAEMLLDCDDLYFAANLQLLTELNLALQAEALMHRDVDYIVRDGRVEIVDDFTGRVVKDRHWPHGLQTAIETKEGLRSSEEARILGSITLQHFLGLYPHLSGMTATAESAADELYKFYGLELLVVPPNTPSIRLDEVDLIFPNKQDKRQSLLKEIAAVRRMGRPVLVGTTSVAESEELAADLRHSGVDCAVLNANRDFDEAQIVSNAGALNAVTISTNMAGRGTDIRLGGRDEEDYAKVASLGGLCVIGTNRHESRRIDDQLRGRAGRQGDPGSSRYFISLEDELLSNYRISDSLSSRWRSVVEDEGIDSAILRNQVDRAQRIVEGQNYDIRQTLWRYSHFIEQQRRVIASRRRGILEGSADSGLFQEELLGKRHKMVQLLGEDTVVDLERRLVLQAIDECWSKHLANVTEIRDGIHLAEVGGMDPYREFLKLAAESFEESLEAIDETAENNFATIEFTAEGVDLDSMGLRGPSSTWTYLVTDQGISDRLTAALVGGRNIGFALGAALTGPLLMLWALTRRKKPWR